MDGERREIVVPGTVLGTRQENVKAGDGTFRRDGEVVANIVGLANPRGEFMNLIPLAGRYIPRSDKKDLVIGIIVETAPSYWNVDINGPTTAMLHVNDTPWKVDFGETVRYLNIGDAIIAKVSEVGALNKTYVSLKDKGLRKIESGHIITMSPAKVPRVIGKKGSMLALLKSRTDCRIFVGQNGRVWVEGRPEEVARLEAAISMIEERSHLPGLTQEIERFLGGSAGAREPSHGAEDDAGREKGLHEGEPRRERTAPPVARHERHPDHVKAPQRIDMPPAVEEHPFEHEEPPGSSGDLIEWAKREAVRDRDLENGRKEDGEYGEIVPGTNVKLKIAEDEEAGE